MATSIATRGRAQTEGDVFRQLLFYNVSNQRLLCARVCEFQFEAFDEIKEERIRPKWPF